MKPEQPEDVCLDRPVSEVWTQVLELLQKKLSKPSYEAWLLPTRLLELSAEEVVMGVSNDFAKTRLTTIYAAEIEKSFEEVLGRKVRIKVIIDLSPGEREYTPSIASITVVPQKQKEQHRQITETERSLRAEQSMLNPKHLFHSFVVGSSNRFSHAAALAVADKPGQAYNPLFLYGGVGLGKTHLLHAIGNAILQKAPNTVIRYMSCEKFTNEVINSIRDDKMVDFRKRYRKIDLLLMDDIQFIEGKESTQEEFFHTFNHLRDSGKQIVLTSDRPPKALAKLAERLRSRFEWGLITDIQAPDYEMRLAILRKKAEQENMLIPDSVLDHIAATFTSNIRELEGALLRAHAFASLTGASLSPESVRDILQAGAKKKDRPPLTVERVIDAVSSHFRVEPADLRSSKRSQDLTVPRHIAMYLAHEIVSLSFPRVGQAFGNRKHTSTKYAYDKVKEEISKDPAIAETVRKITALLDN
ncbi:MAG: chromosomal replication initiator protein DnaA [Candidatus Obscuribacterales bacterium]|nr:chromosomal replication initiator protein DnaA [Candidatus Obscuribacterales bacterium]